MVRASVRFLLFTRTAAIIEIWCPVLGWSTTSNQTH